MLIQPPEKITPETLYFSRRKFLYLAGLIGVTAALAACGVSPNSTGQSSGTSTPLVDTLTPYDTITHYNNFYEFALDKESVADKAANLDTSNWTVEIGGLVNNPGILSAKEILQTYPQEERVYRLRCVEGWSIVVPWQGFPLHKLLADIGVKESAKFIRFTTPMDIKMFPNETNTLFPWPYVEGLRLDEANHDLTILAGGLYGKPLPPQDGAPIRLVVPWKYGFKSAKSISKIELVEEQPVNFWQATSPSQYGFYSNVNPDVPQPGWSQSTERRLGELDRRPTLLFNGYDQVASLYAGMDLVENF